MSKRRKKIREVAPKIAPRLSGTARLLSEIPTDRLDLHGLSAREAEVRVRHFLERHVRSSRGRVVHIITGKGTHSDGPAVLPGLVNGLLCGEFGQNVAEYAGLVGGGAIAVRIEGVARA